MWLALGAMLAADMSLSCKHFSHLWMALWAVHLGLITTNWGPRFIKHCTWTYLLLTIALGRCYYPHFTEKVAEIQSDYRSYPNSYNKGVAGTQSRSLKLEQLLRPTGCDSRAGLSTPTKTAKTIVSVNMASMPNVQTCNKENGCKEGEPEGE